MNVGIFRWILITVLALIPFTAVHAAGPPQFSIVNLDFVFPIAGCDFPAEGELTATLKASTHLNPDGSFKMLVERVQDQIATYTNLETGVSISSNKGGGIDKILIGEDGTIKFLVMGLIDIIPGRGRGLIVQDVGRIVLDTTTGEFLFSAGKFTVHGPGGDVQALCAALE